MRVLLAGGAGFVGSHTAVSLIEAGHDVAVYDDLSNSSDVAVGRIRQITGRDVPFRAGDARDVEFLRSFVREVGPVDAVILFAGLKSVEESVRNPLRYYSVNIGVAVSVLEMMARERISTVIFSSSATVYGNDSSPPYTEGSPAPITLANPYGKTKRIVEEILSDAAAASADMRAISLRYFNPVGAHPSGLLGEDPAGTPTNLMPFVAKVAAGDLDRVGVFGNDYDTPDGTGQRDFIHVMDLAEGHVSALENASRGYSVYNLGTGHPVSVLELIAAFSQACGMQIPFEILPRRAGDVAVSYCDPTKANRELHWRASRSLDDACRDAWHWQSLNPFGYATASRANR